MNASEASRDDSPAHGSGAAGIVIVLVIFTAALAFIKWRIREFINDGKKALRSEPADETEGLNVVDADGYVIYDAAEREKKRMPLLTMHGQE